MPTGYTASVESGEITDLRAFAFQCSRAFGALVTMCDDPLDAPIPERFEPNTSYYDDALAAAVQTLETLPLLSADECVTRAKAEYEAALASYKARRAEHDAEQGRYRRMLALVEQWEPHAAISDLRSFMLDQLSESLRFMYCPEPPERVSGGDWKIAKLADAARDLKYHTDERAKEIDRVRKRNEWIAALRASLPGDSKAGE